MRDDRRVGIAGALVLGLAAGCSPAPPEAAAAAPATTLAAAAEETLEPAPEATPLPDGLPPFAQPWKGDLDGMAKRRVVRVLTVQSPVIYFVDRGREGGATYEAAQAFGEELNKSLGNTNVKVHVIMIPVSRDRLLPALLEGRGDVAAAQLTVTPERQKLVDFSEPLGRNVSEIVVTGPAAPALKSLDDLSGQDVYVRLSSSYAENLKALNARFKAEGKAPVTLVAADENLEDGDILEMVNAGLVPMAVVDNFVAELWAQVFPHLKPHPELAVHTGGDIAWAFRKDSPKLRAAVNGFVKGHAQGTRLGNIVINKYLKNTKWVKNANSTEDRKRYESMVALFKKYSQKYDSDYLLMIAQGYQESQLDQTRRSHVGAIGVMQVMPATARDRAVGIPDIENLESNIHAGVKYMRFIRDQYYADSPIDRTNRMLFAFASYNAGPARVTKLRREAKESGLDPNKWFGNVELIAAKRIGRETVQYVANIYKYYLAYKLTENAKHAKPKAS